MTPLTAFTVSPPNLWIIRHYKDLSWRELFYLLKLLSKSNHLDPSFGCRFGLKHRDVLHDVLIEIVEVRHSVVVEPVAPSEGEVPLLSHAVLTGRDLVDVPNNDGVEDDVHDEHDQD